MWIKSSTGQLSKFQFQHNSKYCGDRQGGAFSPNPQWLGEKDVQLVLRLIYGWTVVHGHRLLRSSLCRWSQCWCSNYPRVTTWNQQHTTQFATQSGCRHASRVSWSLGPDLRQLFECHRNNVNDVQPSHAPTQSQRCCNVLFLHRRLRLLSVCANVWLNKTWRNVEKPRIKQQKSFESQSGCSADHPLAIKDSKECSDERCQEKLHLSVQLRSFGVTESLRTKLEV